MLATVPAPSGPRACTPPDAPGVHSPGQGAVRRVEFLFTACDIPSMSSSAGCRRGHGGRHARARGS